ncbi:hypothetical protein K5549_013870 [Capra hircus]|nr:hypothetical protein K5549_013870 [Capra hircus]
MRLDGCMLMFAEVETPRSPTLPLRGSASKEPLHARSTRPLAEQAPADFLPFGATCHGFLTKDNPEVEKRDPQELVDGAFAAHSPCPGEPQAGNAVSGSPSDLSFFWTRCLQQGWQNSSVLSTASFSERVRNMSPDEIKIPPEPPGRCSNHLQDKIQKLYERKIKEGMDMNYIIQRKKEFRNPRASGSGPLSTLWPSSFSIYEKLIQFCAIDELGTNYPKRLAEQVWTGPRQGAGRSAALCAGAWLRELGGVSRGPLPRVPGPKPVACGPPDLARRHVWLGPSKAQKIEMDKLEKAKKERTKIEFVTGTKKGTTTNAPATTTTTASTAVADAQKRKSKWDSAIPVTTIAQPTILTTTATLPAVVTVTTSASGSKTTVISAVGTIVKKAKQ